MDQQPIKTRTMGFLMCQTMNDVMDRLAQVRLDHPNVEVEVGDFSIDPETGMWTVFFFYPDTRH